MEKTLSEMFKETVQGRVDAIMDPSKRGRDFIKKEGFINGLIHETKVELQEDADTVNAAIKDFNDKYAYTPGETMSGKAVRTDDLAAARSLAAERELGISSHDRESDLALEACD